MNEYEHDCYGCGYHWSDTHRYFHCPWCGGTVSNDMIDEIGREPGFHILVGGIE